MSTGIPYGRGRFSVELVGRESGMYTPGDGKGLSFLRFPDEADAQVWCDERNRDDSLTQWVPVDTGNPDHWWQKIVRR